MCKYCEIDKISHEAKRKFRKNQRMTVSIVTNMFNEDMYYLNIKSTHGTSECININYCPACRQKIRSVIHMTKEIKVRAYSIQHLKRQIHGRKDCIIYITHSCSNEIKKIDFSDYLELEEDLKSRNIKLKVEEDI